MACCFIWMSCQNKDQAEKVADSVATETPAPTQDKEDNVAIPDFTDLEQYVGKKPTEVDLFSQYNLKERMIKLIGENGFNEMMTDWSLESPIKEDDRIVYFTGCNATNCPANRYFIMLDIADPNINIVNYRFKSSRSYEESSVIGMTDKLANAFEQFRDANE